MLEGPGDGTINVGAERVQIQLVRERGGASDVAARARAQLRSRRRLARRASLRRDIGRPFHRKRNEVFFT